MKYSINVENGFDGDMTLTTEVSIEDIQKIVDICGVELDEGLLNTNITIQETTQEEIDKACVNAMTYDGMSEEDAIAYVQNEKKQ